MSVKLKCPTCGAPSTAPDEAAGKKARCKQCDTVFVIRGRTAPGSAQPGRGAPPSAAGAKQQPPAWKPLVLLGPAVLAMIVGAFLPWMAEEREASYGQERGAHSHWNGFSTVTKIEFDGDGQPRAGFGHMGITFLPGLTVSAGFLIVLLSVSTVSLAALRRPRWAMVFGALAVILTAYMVLRTTQDVVAANENNVNVSMGVGIWIVLAGAVLTLIGGAVAPNSNSGKGETAR